MEIKQLITPYRKDMEQYLILAEHKKLSGIDLSYDQSVQIDTIKFCLLNEEKEIELLNSDICIDGNHLHMYPEWLFIDIYIINEEKKYSIYENKLYRIFKLFEIKFGIEAEKYHSWINVIHQYDNHYDNDDNDDDDQEWEIIRIKHLTKREVERI